jgi:hypothetical protein
MLLLNCFLRVLLAVVFLAQALSAQVLELGESQLHGKKDQPEAITFVARAPLDDTSKVVEIKKTSNKIKEEIRSPIFDLLGQRF